MPKSKSMFQPYSLSRIFTAYMVSNFSTLFMGKKHCRFPDRIDDYIFKSNLKKIGPKKSYQLAIYTDSKGNKALAKMRSAVVHDYHYFSLLNEIAVYKALNAVIVRRRRDIENRFPDVHIPKLITTVETKGCLLMLLQFVSGDSTAKLSDKRQVEIYIKTSKYLSYLGKCMTAGEMSSLAYRSVYNLVFLYPFLLLKALLNFPGSAGVLLRGVPVFISSVPNLLKHRHQLLIHRDLHFYNILENDKGLYLLDLQQCVFAEEIQEWVTTLRYYWKEGSFYKGFLKEIHRRFSHRLGFTSIFRGLMVNSVTHGLTDRSFSLTIINHWLDVLNFTLNNHD